MSSSEGEYIIEFVRLDKTVKVTAFDPGTLTEATVVTPAKLARSDMTALAVRKLEYLLKKKKKKKKENK